MRRLYEHRSFPLRLWIFRTVWTLVALICLAGLVASIQRGNLNAFLGAIVFVFGLCGLLVLATTAARLFRPHMIVNGDDVRVYYGEFGTTCNPFHWSAVINWEQVVVPNEEEHGPAEYRNIRVTLADRSDPLTVWDVSDDYMRAFEEHVPGRRSGT